MHLQSFLSAVFHVEIMLKSSCGYVAGMQRHKQLHICVCVSCRRKTHYTTQRWSCDLRSVAVNSMFEEWQCYYSTICDSRWGLHSEKHNWTCGTWSSLSVYAQVCLKDKNTAAGRLCTFRDLQNTIEVKWHLCCKWLQSGSKYISPPSLKWMRTIWQSSNAHIQSVDITPKRITIKTF